MIYENVGLILDAINAIARKEEKAKNFAHTRRCMITVSSTSRLRYSPRRHRGATFLIHIPSLSLAHPGPQSNSNPRLVRRKQIHDHPLPPWAASTNGYFGTIKLRTNFEKKKKGTTNLSKLRRSHRNSSEGGRGRKGKKEAVESSSLSPVRPLLNWWWYLLDIYIWGLFGHRILVPRSLSSRAFVERNPDSPLLLCTPVETYLIEDAANLPKFNYLILNFTSALLIIWLRKI